MNQEDYNGMREALKKAIKNAKDPLQKERLTKLRLTLDEAANKSTSTEEWFKKFITAFASQILSREVAELLREFL